MTTEYRLCKVDLPEYFDLGKNTSYLFDSYHWYYPFILTDVYDNADNLAEFYVMMIGDHLTEPFNMIEFRCYALRVATKIFAWAKTDRLIVVADVGFDALVSIVERFGNDKSLIWYEYQESGSRYEP